MNPIFMAFRQAEVDHPWDRRQAPARRRTPSFIPPSTPADYTARNIGKIPQQNQITIIRFKRQLADEGFIEKSDMSSLATSDIQNRELTLLCMACPDDQNREVRVTITFKESEMRNRQWQIRIHDPSRPKSRLETGALEEIVVTLQRFLVQCRAKRQLPLG